MSANIELALLTSVIDNRDFHSLEKAQITSEYFATQEAKQVYDYLRSVYFDAQTAGQVPSREMVNYRFQSFYPFPSTDSVAVLAAQLRREKVRMDLLNLATDLQQKAESDPIAAMAELRVASAKISSLSEVGEDLSMAGAYSMLADEYRVVQEAGGMLGIPYPWAALNDETQGMQPGQFIVLYGRPKSMKSWIAIYIGVYAYLFARRRVLFYTREMHPKMVARRVASCMARVDYGKFKSGKLQPDVAARAFEFLQGLGDDEKYTGAAGSHQPFFDIVSDRSSGGGGGGGVGWLQAKIRERRPDLVIVDGMYLMKDDRSGQRTVDWKAIAHISQDLKLTAQEFEIPLIGVTQANRNAQKTQGEDLTELAFSDALGQDADAVFRVIKEDVQEESGHKKTELKITAPGLREGKFDGIVIHGEPGYNFNYIRTIIDKDEASKEEMKQSGPKPTFKRNMTDPRMPVRK